MLKIMGMINEYENTHIEINIERAVFNYDYKITTRTPFMFDLICTVRKKESNIFT